MTHVDEDGLSPRAQSMLACIHFRSLPPLRRGSASTLLSIQVIRRNLLRRGHDTTLCRVTTIYETDSKPCNYGKSSFFPNPTLKTINKKRNPVA
jgi:hypothetical protein